MLLRFGRNTDTGIFQHDSEFDESRHTSRTLEAINQHLRDYNLIDCFVESLLK